MNNTIQKIVHDIELGRAQILTRIIPLVLTLCGIGFLYNYSVYRGLSDSQSMDNAQLGRQIARGQGFTTKFIRPYALFQLRDFNASKSASPGESNPLFPADRFPNGVQRILPDTYNAPGYPCLLAAYFYITHPLFDQSVNDMTTKHMYPADRMIPFVNLGFMVLTILLIFGLAIRLFDERVAWMSVLTFIATDMVWKFTLTALPTHALMFLVTALMFCALEIFTIGEDCRDSEENSFSMAWLWTLLLGLCLAVACLMQLQVLILLVPVLLILVLMPRGNFLLFTLVALIALGAVVPWFWHVYKVSGNPLGSNIAQLLYGEDGYEGNQIYCTTSIPLYQSLLANITHKECVGFRWNFEHAWELLGSNPLIILFAASILHGFRRLRAQAFVWLVFGSALLLVTTYNLGVAKPEPFSSWNSLILLLPCMLVAGNAFFFILFDRLELQVPLFRTIILVFTLMVTAIPLALTASTTTNLFYSFPPYMPPAIKLVSQFAEPEEWVATDMPWASAWYSDHASLWLPDSINDFQNINDTICPVGMLYFTPVTWLKPVSNVTTGEEKDWLPFISVTTLPANFPLRVHTMTAPGGPEYSIWSDRPRWANQQAPPP